MNKNLFLIICGVAISTCVSANPQEGIVRAGEASIHQPTPGYTEINQVSDRAVIDWKSFNIAGDEHTHFKQPSSLSATLNRVTEGNPSSILGHLSADGQIYLINPAGIFFGKNAIVDVSAIIATTAAIDSTDFMYHQNRLLYMPGNTAVVNEGVINIVRNGFVMLAAPTVQNAGTVAINVVREALPGVIGTEVSFVGGNPNVYFSMGENGPIMNNEMPGINNAPNNTGVIMIPHEDAKMIVDNIVNMDGVSEATKVINVGSEIKLVDGRN